MRTFAAFALFVLAALIIANPARLVSDPVTVNWVKETVESTAGDGHNVSFQLTINGYGGLSTSTNGGFGPSQGAGLLPGGVSPNGAGGGDSGGTSSGTTGTSTTTTGTTYEQLVIANPAKFGSVPVTPTSISQTALVGTYMYHGTAGDGTGGSYVTVVPGNTVQIKGLFGANTSATKAVDVGILYHFKDLSNVWHSYYAWWEYDMVKQTLTAIAITSRKMYGQPNLAGAVAGDQRNPNAPARAVSYWNWLLRPGGLFTGHASFQTGDQSGTSRIQAYTPTGKALASSATLYYLQNPQGFTDPFTCTAYATLVTEPFIPPTYPASGETWANGWTLNQTGSNLNTVYDNFSYTSAQASNYLNWQIMSGSNTYAPYVLLAMNPEPGPSSTPNTWMYFVSANYAATVPAAADQGPRQWVVRATKTYEVTIP